MALPWLRIIDAVIGVTDLARRRSYRSRSDAQEELTPSGVLLGGLETRLAGVVIAALKEAFERDTRRLELEREQLEVERQRAERALRLEWLRQAGDREMARLRLVAGVAVAGWIGTLFFSARLIGAGSGARVALGVGWALLFAALASAFAGQSRIARTLTGLADGVSAREEVSSGVAGALAPWLIVFGLVLVSAAVLVA